MVNTEASPTSASNLEWFINNFMEGDRTAAAARGIVSLRSMQ